MTSACAFARLGRALQRMRTVNELVAAQFTSLLAPNHELDALNLARSELVLVEHRAEATRSIQKSLSKRMVCDVAHPCRACLPGSAKARPCLFLHCSCAQSQGWGARGRAYKPARLTVAQLQEILRRLTEAAKDTGGGSSSTATPHHDGLRKMVCLAPPCVLPLPRACLCPICARPGSRLDFGRQMRLRAGTKRKA